MTAVPPENDRTGLVLRYASYVGVAVMAAGLFLSALGLGDTVTLAGIGLLILGPLVGLVTTLVCLLKAGDRHWAGVAALLLVILLVACALTYCL